MLNRDVMHESLRSSVAAAMRDALGSHYIMPHVLAITDGLMPTLDPLLTHIDTLAARVSALEDALVEEMAQRLYAEALDTTAWKWDGIGADQRYWLIKARTTIAATYPTEEG